MKTNFKEFFYKTLLETPMNTGDFYSEYSDTKIAQNQFDEITNKPSAKIVFTLYPDTHPVYLYEDRDGNDISLYFVPKEDNFIYGYATYEELGDGGVMMTSVYNRPMYHGLAQGVYNRYIIPKYKYIMSDGRHSPSGRSFWRKIVLANIANHVVEIWDMDKKETVVRINNVAQLDEYYGDTVDYERFRIKMSK